ncbi:MAG: TRAP transporter small permease [Candidatus Adiutrix sp.]|jgi:TRAP-type C4-dicarboxylate transport system permease small subunit|nr:TRAP transporter small permease [Candidatus Adiutrix sp.]
MKKVLNLFNDKFEEYFLVSTLAFSVALIFAQVVMRYAFNNSISWSEELARYLFIWQAWIAVGFAAKRSRHICLDFVVNMCPPRAQTVLYWVSHCIWLAFGLYMTWKSAEFTQMIFKRNTISAAMALKMGWVYLAVPVGCGLMSFRLIQVMAAKIKSAGKERA